MLVTWIAMALAVAICRVANIKWRRSLVETGSYNLMERGILLSNLSPWASVALALGRVWGWGRVFVGSYSLADLALIHQDIAPFIPPLFTLVCVTTGRHLRRSPQTN